jgi:hypothetical protein
VEYLACVALTENLGWTASVKGAGGVSEVKRRFFYLYSCINLVAGMCVTNDFVGARERTMKTRRRTSSYTICSQLLDFLTRKESNMWLRRRA